MQQIFLHGLGQTPNSWERTIMQLKFAAPSVCPDLAELVRGQVATYQQIVLFLLLRCFLDNIRFSGVRGCNYLDGTKFLKGFFT